jgi:hypothetical protein
MPTKVNGGIINDQMLAGSLRHFKLDMDFGVAVSPGNIKLAHSQQGGNPLVITYFTVPDGKGVPDSGAELALRVVMEKCTVVQIGLVETSNRVDEIHIACENTSFGWADAAAMQAAIRALGAAVTVPDEAASPDPATGDPVTEDLNFSTMTVTEVPYELA